VKEVILMSTAQVTVLVIIIVAVLLLVGVAIVMNRRRSLRQRFGPEYDRVVESAEDRRAAERELRERERRHAELELRELDPASRDRYAASWEEIQVRFVDAPEQAVGEADELVTRLIAERGYPTGDYDDQLAHLSVEHARTLEHYRKAHDIHERNARGEATTEQLRQALVHYRALFADLLGTQPDRLSGSNHHDSDATPDRERQP
jgi:C4-dicarboxylate-specific signal transduction histidine kinase